MKKALFLAALLFWGCESVTESDVESLESRILELEEQAETKTVSLGFRQRDYRFMEVYDDTGKLYKIYNTYTGSYYDTLWIDVPAGDSLDLLIHRDDYSYLIERIAVAPDSVYWIK